MNSNRAVSLRLIQLAAPIVGLNLLNVIALAVDTAMCGQLENNELVLKGLSYALQYIFFMLVFMIGLTVGTVALVARAHGAGEIERANHIFDQSIKFTIFLGIAVATLGNMLAPFVLRLLNAPDDAIDQALIYLRPLLTGTMFYYLAILFGAVLRGVGNTLIAFLVALTSNVLNFLLNYGLILGNWGMPQLGLEGAALGTVISQATGVAIMIVILRRNSIQGLRIQWPRLRFDHKLLKEIISVSFPAALDMAVFTFGIAVLVVLLEGADGMAVAAHGVGFRVQAIAFIPGLSISQATGALVGQALGKGDTQATRRITAASVKLCSLVMSTIAIFLLIFSTDVVALFGVQPNTQLETLSVLWMLLLGCAMPVVGLTVTLFGVFQGAGATKLSLRVNALVTFLVQIPLAITLGHWLELGAFGVWASFPIANAFKAIIGTVLYFQGSWEKVGLKAANR